MKQLLRPLARRLRSAEYVVRNALGFIESDEKLVRDSQCYWDQPETEAQRYNSHWRGHGDFSDDDRWLSVGRQHLELFETFARGVGLERPLSRVVEWGCGGGANAVHFAPLAGEFVGVDVAQASLDECGRQVATAAPATSYVPVLIRAEDPEAACAGLEGQCDLFLCVYVFELLSSPDYARRVLKAAHRMLRPGGMAK